MPRIGFEGGQTPFYRLVPKHGFTNKMLVYIIEGKSMSLIKFTFRTVLAIHISFLSI